jgi:hypothetical protein
VDERGWQLGICPRCAQRYLSGKFWRLCYQSDQLARSPHGEWAANVQFSGRRVVAHRTSESRAERGDQKLRRGLGAVYAADHCASFSAKPEDLHKVLPRIEELENVLAIELGIEPDMASADVKELAIAASGELPLIVQLPQQRASELSEAAMDGGAAAISLGPPRGMLPGADGKLVSGRLYGPAQSPLALATVVELAKNGVAVIGAGGVETQVQGEAMLAAGALAVQLDIALWKSGSIATI